MNLCKVVAIFDEMHLPEVEHVLVTHRIRGFTLHSVKGRGRYFRSMTESHLIQHVQMEIYTTEDQADALSELLVQKTHCGAESEGVVSIIPIKKLTWIHEKREAQVSDFRFTETSTNG